MSCGGIRTEPNAPAFLGGTFRASVREPPVPPAEIAGTASVIDGDTIEIHALRVRLAGIDAPEGAQLCSTPEAVAWRCGQAAALALADFIGRSPVVCSISEQDRYGRALSRCYRGDVEINAWLVANGWAVRYYDENGSYSRLQRGAASARRGIWSGSFVRPSDWRR